LRDSKDTPLFDALQNFSKQIPISFHVPGHKNGTVFPEKGQLAFKPILTLDLTELTGLDDLHAPEGIIRDAEEMAADYFGADQTFFLVGGSTAGNLAMILSTTGRGEHIIVQRNCHKSVMNGIELAGARPVFIAPEFDKRVNRYTHPSIETLRQAIQQYPDARAIVLTYPDYFGNTYSIDEMIDRAHKSGIPVLVDEAHGVHFSLGTPLPPSSLNLGADVVVQSAHKMAPAMTMASYLHIKGNLVNSAKIARYLQVIQSSSPSYPLMASLDLARSFLETTTKEQLQSAIDSVEEMKKEMRKLNSCRVIDNTVHDDPFKITLQTGEGRSGYDVMHLFEEAGIYPELATEDQVLFVAGLRAPEHFEDFKKALTIVNEELKKATNHATIDKVQLFPEKVQELALSNDEMNERSYIEVPLEQGIGCIAAEAVIPYPPGIPLIMRGERIGVEQIELLKKLISQGTRLQQRHAAGNIQVFC